MEGKACKSNLSAEKYSFQKVEGLAKRIFLAASLSPGNTAQLRLAHERQMNPHVVAEGQQMHNKAVFRGAGGLGRAQGPGVRASLSLLLHSQFLPSMLRAPSAAQHLKMEHKNF